MARFGKLPVKIPEGVQVSVRDGRVVVTGPKGELERRIADGIEIKIKDGGVVVEKVGGGKQAESSQGTYRAHVLNMVRGVTEGWEKELEIVGAGYRAAVEGTNLVLNIGYSHPVKIEIPEGVGVTVDKSIVKLVGADKELIGHMTALIRSKREPEPYKGAGIKYVGEEIRRKAGKQAAKSEGA